MGDVDIERDGFVATLLIRGSGDHNAVGGTLAARPPLAVRAHLRALRASQESTLSEQLELEWDSQSSAVFARYLQVAVESVLDLEKAAAG